MEEIPTVHFTPSPKTYKPILLKNNSSDQAPWQFSTSGEQWLKTKFDVSSFSLPSPSTAKAAYCWSYSPNNLHSIYIWIPRHSGGDGGWDFKDKRSQNQAPKVFWAKGIFGTGSWERLQIKIAYSNFVPQKHTPSKAQNLIMDFMKKGPRVGLFKHNEAKRKWNTILAVSYPFQKTRWNSHLYHLQAKRESSKLRRKPEQEKREVGCWVLCTWSQPFLPTNASFKPNSLWFLVSPPVPSLAEQSISHFHLSLPYLSSQGIISSWLLSHAAMLLLPIQTSTIVYFFKL